MRKLIALGLLIGLFGAVQLMKAQEKLSKVELYGDITTFASISTPIFPGFHSRKPSTPAAEADSLSTTPTAGSE